MAKSPHLIVIFWFIDIIWPNFSTQRFGRKFFFHGIPFGLFNLRYLSIYFYTVTHIWPWSSITVWGCDVTRSKSQTHKHMRLRGAIIMMTWPQTGWWFCQGVEWESTENWGGGATWTNQPSFLSQPFHNPPKYYEDKYTCLPWLPTHTHTTFKYEPPFFFVGKPGPSLLGMYLDVVGENRIYTMKRGLTPSIISHA